MARRKATPELMPLITLAIIGAGAWFAWQAWQKNQKQKAIAGPPAPAATGAPPLLARPPEEEISEFDLILANQPEVMGPPAPVGDEIVV